MNTDRVYFGHFKTTEEIGELIVELGQLLQVMGKVGPFPSGNHPDGAGDLRQRLTNEVADVMGACTYFVRRNGLDEDAVRKRAAMKVARFEKWGLTGIPNEDQP